MESLFLFDDITISLYRFDSKFEYKYFFFCTTMNVQRTSNWNEMFVEVRDTEFFVLLVVCGQV